MCEFITGGGLCGQPLPKSLASEGALMRDALLQDLAQLPVEVVTTIDARLEASSHAACSVVPVSHNAWQIWASLMNTCDAVWVIAPETDGILAKFAQLTHDLGKVWLGCSVDAINICGDKLKTEELLKSHGAATPTFTLDTFLNNQQDKAANVLADSHRYIAKPRFGAGCEDTQVFADVEKLLAFMQQNRAKSHIIQPYIEGQAASLTMLCQQGSAWLLSANKQLITSKNNTLQFNGVIVNDFAQHTIAFSLIAKNVANWLPSLNGIVGVDIVLGDKTPCIIEINSRLTTSYVGLAQSIGQNPAKLVLDSWQNVDFTLPILLQNKVEIRV